MKKLLKLSAVILAVGVIFLSAGFIWVHGDGVSAGAIYSRIEESLKLGGEDGELEKPVKYDLSGVSDKSASKSLGYELNEFNTVELYAENCTVEFSPLKGDLMTAKLDEGSLTTAITGGRLHVQAVGSEISDTLRIGVPEGYKGGYVINAVGCKAKLGDIDSAMDVSFDLHDSEFSCGDVSADSIDLRVGGSTLELGAFSASDELTLASSSSDIVIEKINAGYTAVTLNNSNANLKDMTGGVMCSARTSDVSAAFSEVTGNITLDVSTGKAQIKLPTGSNIAIRHDEDYGIFDDRTKSAQNEGSNEAVRYTMETNIKFGIVTVTN